MTDELTNHIQRLLRRRYVIQQIHKKGRLTRSSIAALWRTTKPADQPRLIRWAIQQAQHTKDTQ